MNAERFALDTNVLVYAIDNQSGDKQARARAIIGQAVVSRRCVLAVQNVGEFYAATQRRRLLSVAELVEMGHELLRMFPVVASDPADAGAALDAVAGGQLSYWDALLLATLGRVGCTVVLSEDMQDGYRFAGVTVRNPFAGDDLPTSLEPLFGSGS